MRGTAAISQRAICSFTAMAVAFAMAGCGGTAGKSGSTSVGHGSAQGAAVAPASRAGNGSLLPESATAGEVALAYVHAYASKNFALACDYDPQLAEVAEQRGGCTQYLHELDEKQEKGEAEGVVPESLPEFAHATLKSEVPMPEGDDAVTVVAPTSHGNGEVKILVRRLSGASGPWRVEE